MRDRRIAVAAVIAVAVILAILVFYRPALAAPRPDPSCSWSPAIVAVGEVSTMTAVNLPTNRLVGFSFSDRTLGVWIEQDGSFALDWQVQGDTTLVVWSRGGGDSLWRAGRQLGDYHPIAMCSVEVTP